MKNKNTCFYCNALIAEGQLEKDHFPIPDFANGELTVNSCTTCHDMKDRFNIGDWDELWIKKIVEDFPMLNRETKIFLAKSISLFCSYKKGLP